MYEFKVTLSDGKDMTVEAKRMERRGARYVFTRQDGDDEVIVASYQEHTVDRVTRLDSVR